MGAEYFEPLRREMVAEICAQANLARAWIGKAAFDERIMDVIGKVPRHEFVPFELQPFAYDHGWSKHAPFDKVMVTAAPDLIPPPLIHQLKPGGRMVIPSGLPEAQQLILVEKDSNSRVKTKEILPVRFSQLEIAESG